MGSPFFSTGQTRASLKGEGNTPVFRDPLMSIVREGARWARLNFRIDGGMPSGPADFHGFRLRSILEMSSTETGENKVKPDSSCGPDLGLVGHGPCLHSRGSDLSFEDTCQVIYVHGQSCVWLVATKQTIQQLPLGSWVIFSGGELSYMVLSS